LNAVPSVFHEMHVLRMDNGKEADFSLLLFLIKYCNKYGRWSKTGHFFPLQKCCSFPM